MSYLHVQQLVAIEEEYNAARAALTYAERAWHRLASEPEMRALSRSHMRRGSNGLEITYIVRLFSEFEALLQDHLAVSRPRLRMPRTAEALLNRVALHERFPDPIRGGAQAVRQYRNTIVHRRIGASASLGFRETTAALNRYLARLSDSP